MANSEEAATRRNEVAQAVYGRDLSATEQKTLAGDMGNGSLSLQGFRTVGAHSEEAAHTYTAMVQNVTGHDPSAEALGQIEDAIGNGSSLAEERHRLASSDEVRASDAALTKRMTGKDATEGQFGYYRWLHEIDTNRRDFAYKIAYGREAQEQITETFTQMTDDAATATDNVRNYYSWQMAEKQDWNTIHNDIAHSDEVRASDAALTKRMTGKDATEGQFGYYRWLHEIDTNRRDFAYKIAYGREAQEQITETFTQMTGDAATATDNVRNYYSWQMAEKQDWNTIHNDIAHSDEVFNYYKDLFQKMTGQQAGNEQIHTCQDDLANGADAANIRHRIAFSDAGRQGVEVQLKRLGIDQPTDSQYNYFQTMLANGSNGEDVYRQAVHGGEGSYAIDVELSRLGIQRPTDFQYDYFKKMLTDGKSLEDVYRQAASGWEGRQAIGKILNDIGEIQNPTDAQYQRYQNMLANGKSLTDVEQAVAGPVPLAPPPNIDPHFVNKHEDRPKQNITVAYVPPLGKYPNEYPAPYSGATIGHGGDIAQHTKQEFRDMGVAESTLDKIPDKFFALAPGQRGLHGDDAANALDELAKQGHPVKLTMREAEYISSALFNKTVHHVGKLYDNTTGQTGSFDALPENVRNVIIDLAYNMGDGFGFTSPERQTLWKQFIDHDYEGAITSMKNILGANNYRVIDDIKELSKSIP